MVPYEGEIPLYGDRAEPPEDLDQFCRAVIGAAIEVHRQLGPGLPEKAYEGAMAVEMKLRGIPFERQKRVKILYKGVCVDEGVIDLLVGGKLVVELKAIAAVVAVHRLRTLTYMRIIKQPLGLIINFDVALLRDGISRVIESTP